MGAGARKILRDVLPIGGRRRARTVAVLGVMLELGAVHEEEHARIGRYAAEHGVDLSASYAYADSASDLPLLRAVGRPVAVNPDATTLRAAKAGGWPVHDWRSGGRPERAVVRR